MAHGGAEDTMQTASDAVGGRKRTKCEPRSRPDSSDVASLNCNTCKVYSCDDCSDGHKMYMSNVNELQFLAAHDTCVKPNVDIKGIAQCNDHKRVFMFHCEDHDDMCCEICAFSRHRRCNNVQEIAKVAKTVIDDEMENIHALIITASEVVTKCKEAKLSNVSRVEKVVKEIDVYKEILSKKIEEPKAGIIREMTDNYKKEDHILNTMRNTAETLKKELDTHLAMLESVRENGTKTEIFILNHILKRMQNNASQTLKTLLENDNTVKFGLTENELFSKIKLSDVPLISLKKAQKQKIQSLNGDDVIKTSICSTMVINVQQRLARLTLLKTLDLVKTGEDEKEPFVTGLDFLPDGRVVAVDHRNWKCFILSDTLKRFDTFYKFKTYPCDVTSYSDENIAVTVDDRTICLLTVNSDNTIKLMKTLSTSTKCCSICRLNYRTFVVSTINDPRHARMIDVDGKESDFDNVKFRSKAYNLGESNCTYTPLHNLLILTDKYSYAVYMYNTVTGSSIEVKDERIQKPTAAYVGPDGSVFVCSGDTNCVIQISPEGVILKSSDVDMIFQLAMTISRDGSRMAVTNGEIGVKKLNCFKIIQEKCDVQVDKVQL